MATPYRHRLRTKAKKTPGENPRVKNAKKVLVDGMWFDSKGESRRYLVLKERFLAGVISKLERQPKFELIPHLTYVNEAGKTRVSQLAITWRADFRYLDSDGHEVVEDFKGWPTDVFKIKLKLFKWRFPDVDIRIVKKVGEGS